MTGETRPLTREGLEEGLLRMRYFTAWRLRETDKAMKLYEELRARRREPERRV
ncbi:hypothetical protein [Streptomyces sp. UNOC14_S4]|uniref:hypothetical protein n=1 Tax=Streptomyces sp. UNOC14_S4 TaxID=2872340 RepID=UPI001E6317FF|nr:hypothetical protein [Streptomyces sp. UNOC14_S4]MCC3770128.1 hypothetical protein [Streptomyces sp. UNOC14_S4]